VSERICYSSGAPWESIVGYSRAVRVGNTIHVSGTTASDARGEVVGIGDAYAQTLHALRTIEAVLQQAGSGLQQVVRTRIYVTDIGNWQPIGRAHSELLGQARPASTMVEVSRLIDPRMLVEIEAEAWLG